MANKKKNSASKKLFSAVAMLTCSAVMLSTATYAWFTMNKEVAVTGMQVNTTVGSNLLISHDTTADTTANAETTFYTSDITAVSALLEPVSTVDGKSFFYTSTSNVQGNGNAIMDTYVAYNPASTEAFNINYQTSGAVGYVDYAFELKANNTTDSTQYIDVTDLELTYGGTSADKAYRVAFFVEDLGTAHTGGAGAAGTLVAIVRNGSATNFDDSTAVSSTSGLSAVTYNDPGLKIAEVAGGTTHYYKVIARLWIEGEDTTCNNSTFNTLKDKWGLNMTLKLNDSSTPVNALALSYAAKTDVSADSASATTFTIDNHVYYQLTTNSTLYCDSATLSNTSRIFKKSSTGNQMYDVTNQCTLPTPVAP